MAGLCLAVGAMFPETASAQEIRDVEVSVLLHSDGSADITQVWDATVVKGTEWYIPIGNLGKGEVLDLRVFENGREYENEGRRWDTSRSLEEKAGRCGIVDKGGDGVELCWGQGSYGDHVWTATFTVTGLVQSLRDYDAFNFMFINPGLVAPPEHASVRIALSDGEPFVKDDIRFWFFGAYGESELTEDGAVLFETTEDMEYKSKVICMMRFEKGLFSPSVSRDIPFEKMQKKAFKGSDYKSSGGGVWAFIRELGFYGVIGALLVILLPLLGLFLVVREILLKLTGKVYKPAVFGAAKLDDLWQREAPFNGSIPATFWVLKKGSRLLFKKDPDNNLIGAYFLKWIQEGLVKPVRDPKKEKRVNLFFPETEFDMEDTCERNLYTMAVEAAGTNRILEAGEFEVWSKKHYDRMLKWPDSVSNEGWDVITRQGLRALSGTGDALNPQGQANAVGVVRFKKFLTDFTIINERNVPEVGLWKDYLVFAQLYGIADKVADGFKKLYPAQFEEYTKTMGLDTTGMFYCINNFGAIGRNTASAAFAAKPSSSGSGGWGGSSSFGGGGGFSGGGFGGGSR